jgi:alpha-tubulin suppressor-like RCC1 family protein
VASGQYHSLAIAKDGSVWAWGFNGSGQTGERGPEARLIPSRVEGVVDATALAAGATFSLALTRDGRVWAWGSNVYGTLGQGSFGGDYPRPVEVVGLPRMVAIASGWQHALAVAEDGSVWAWGSNSGGQLGDGTHESSAAPVRLAGVENASGLSGGLYHSLAVARDGGLWAWGRHGFRTLGLNGQRADRTVPVQVPLPGAAVSAAAGTHGSLVLLADGTVWGWQASATEAGPVYSKLPGFPVQITDLDRVTAVASGASHALVIRR